MPELQREGGGMLTDRQAQALGKQLWIDAFYDRYGCSYQQGAGQRVAYDRVLAPYWQKVGASDAQNIGTGYAALEVLQTVMGIDPNDSAEKLCSIAMLLFAPLSGDIIGGQLATQSKIEAAMPAFGDSNEPEPTRENPPSFTSTPQSSQETWQWIDQAGRENQKQTLIEQLGLREGDPVRAMTMLTGWWWYENYGNGCDDIDNQYRLALGSWHRTDDGEIVFGKGPFAVGMYEGGCTLSDLRVESDAIVFHGVCEQEHEPYSGEGRISITGLKTINLQLPGVNGEGFVLRACPTSEHVDILSVPQFPASEEVSADASASKGEEIDKWGRFGAAGWSVELPANFASGQQQAIIEKGKDIGTAFMAEDSSESLMTFADDLGERPIQYLEARIFYAKCISAAGGRCFELAYGTKDGSRMDPVVERISKSFKALP